MIDVLKKIAFGIERKLDAVFTFPVQKQKDFLARFPEPKDAFERSYFQCRCQARLYGKTLWFLLNLAAGPIASACLARFLRAKTSFVRKADAVFFNDGKPTNILPDSLRERYSRIESTSKWRGALSGADLRFLFHIFRKRPFSWLFLLKTIIKIGRYGRAVAEFAPDAIISCDEFSFTSSVLTEYCRRRGVRLINVMHGEKLFYMRDSFVKYDEFYVWDRSYADLLISLRADPTQFRVEVPRSLIVEPNPAIEKKFDYAYYLAAETDFVLEVIAESLKRLAGRGFRVSVRPHPRHSKIETVERLFEGANIEDVKKTSIEESLLQTKNAISLYSTALNQARHSGIGVVIDDVSNPANFEKLRELNYVALQFRHSLLSEVLESAK